MAASFVKLLYQPLLATDYDAPSGVHTLTLLGVTPANTDSFTRLREQPSLATDQVAGVHTLKAKVV
jgi:hypothetical protein